MASGYEQHRQRVESRRKELGKRLGELFPEPTGLSLEIGCGHGHWLVEFAASFPERRFLGIDIITDRVDRASRKKARAGLRNVDFLKGEAMETLEELPAHVAIDEVFVLFPDPWPKKRHWKNRLFCDRFLAQLADRCRAGARCHFRTDHEGYFEWAEEVVANQSLWARDDSLDWPFERETIFQSKAAAFQSLIIVKRREGCA